VTGNECRGDDVLILLGMSVAVFAGGLWYCPHCASAWVAATLAYFLYVPPAIYGVPGPWEDASQQAIDAYQHFWVPAAVLAGCPAALLAAVVVFKIRSARKAGDENFGSKVIGDGASVSMPEANRSASRAQRARFRAF